MDCPFCSSQQSRVTDKRSSPGGIRRRRECLKCKRRYTTYEKISENGIFVLKKNGTKERFDRVKIETGVEKAFEKRPITKEQIEKMVKEIEEQLRRKGNKEVKSSIIGELVMRKIKKLDNVAYLRFASVYRDFQNIKDFKQELKDL
ncbi:MAG: transcriptional regulator NrdR [Thermodesulfobacteriota bacterium]|nr:MAG: transcriptional regulator NrdR [Thermodesulfobacteriota bacterium]